MNLDSSENLTSKESVRAPRGRAKPQNSLRCRSNSKRGDAQPVEYSYQPVEAARRVLRVLRAMNSLRSASLAELHTVTGLSKSTVVRMLETLIVEGYVVRDNFISGYRLTSEAQHLSSGFRGLPLVIEAARPWAVQLTERIKWPVSVATVDHGKLSVDFTTSAISPWSFPFTTLHRELSLANSALGRCYLAFCSPSEREHLLLDLRNNGNGQQEFDPAVLDYALKTARERGFAVQDGMRGARQFQFIGVPVLNEGACVACVGVGFYASAPVADHIASDVYVPTREAADMIEKDIARLRARPAELA
jgi:IclR family mhp operon transcriptional activator